MKNLLHADMGAFVLRIALGTVLLMHSVYLKFIVFSLPGTAEFFQSIGLPAVLAYLVFGVESIAGTALLLGYKTRFFSVLIIPVLLGATWAHWSSGWLFTNTGGGWEYPLFLAIAAVVQSMLGDGSYSIRHSDSGAVARGVLQ